MISEQECIRIGGHCYEGTGEVVLTNPPIYHRVCKHCGHIQEGRRQHPIQWIDDPYQPYDTKGLE